MSADIQKEAVFDDRIVQPRPRYAVEKGALSLTNAPFNAIAASQSQMTFNVYVPSENVFVDRALRWTAEGRFQMDVNVAAGAGKFTYWATSSAATGSGSSPAGGGIGSLALNTTTGALVCKPIVSPGVDFSSSPFPLNYLCQTMTATINDTTTVINSQDVLLEVMRLTDYKCNLLQRTCPTMLDKYQANYISNPASGGAINSVMAGYSEAMNVDEVPNGAWPGLYFTDSTGKRLVGNGSFQTSVTDTSGNTIALADVYFVNGVPVVSGTGSDSYNKPFAKYTLYFSIYSTEKLTLSPFVFADDQEWDTGLFGINNIQLIMNFKSGVPLTRIIKTLGDLGNNSVISNIAFNNGATGGVWGNPVLNVQFLTPSLDVPLPPKSVVPYMEFPRFITQSQNGQLDAGSPTYQQATTGVGAQSLAQLQSQTITLPQIPDLLIIYVKASQVAGQPDPTDPSYGDGYIPIASSVVGGVKNPLSINFDNFSGLLSSHTSEELYAMSVHNGLSMTFGQWSGFSRSTIPVNASVTAATGAGGRAIKNAYPPLPAGSSIPTTGGFLVLKPSVDITLQSGQAPSLVGNFTLQFNLQVFNTYPFSVNANLYVITANSGFFESIRGSSRIIKGVLSEQDIISAPVASAQTREGLKRLVGGKVSMGAMANVLHRAKEHYNATKPKEAAMAMTKEPAMEGSGRRGISRRLM